MPTNPIQIDKAPKNEIVLSCGGHFRPEAEARHLESQSSDLIPTPSPPPPPPPPPPLYYRGLNN